MKQNLKDIAIVVNGTLFGNESAFVTGVAGLEQAGPEDISFLRDVSKIEEATASNAGVIFIPTGTAPTFNQKKNVIEVKNPMAAFAKILDVISEEKQPKRTGIHASACVSPLARIGKNVWVGPFAVIEDHAEISDNVSIESQAYIGSRVKIGADTKIYPQVVLREECEIGARCIIHAGAIIGSDGFGFYYDAGKHNKIPQIGNVVVEDDVEIGACSTIDRATTGTTRIGRGSKIDNLVQIAHNVQIGPHSILVAQVGIAGSSELAEGVVLGGQVGVADHVKIGKGAQIAAQSGIKSDVPAGAVLFGSPAQPIQESFRQLTLIKRLPEIFKEIKQLKRSHTEK